MKNYIFLVFFVLFVACESNGEGQSQVEEDVTDDVEEVVELPECPTSAEEPVAVLATWQDDPTTTMTIDWHVEGDAQGRAALCFKEFGDEAFGWESEAQELTYPYGDRRIYRTELTGLEPGTTYAFQVGEFERVFRFRTMPVDIDEEPLVFATGGDTQHAPDMFKKTNRVAAEYDLDFVAWGGDLAYADGGATGFHLERWQWWLESVMETLVDDEDRVIPILVTTGNHEIIDGYYFNHDDFEKSDAWREANAPYFYTFFAFPGHPGFGSLDFGDYLSLLLLDTDHSHPIEGVQTEWLQAQLVERHQRGVPHIFPIYHVPAFPSHRSPDGAVSTRVRETWVPLFEEYGLELAFENHDHTYKRTRPIRGGEVDEEQGVVYIGDGAWGVITRDGDQRDAWYIEEFASDRHAIIVTLLGDDRHVLVLSEDGEVLDEVGEPLR